MPDKYNAAYYRYRRKKRIKEKCCVRCGKPLSYTKSKWCSDCREKHNAYKRQHRKE